VSSATTSRLARVAGGESDELALFHRTLAQLCRADVPLPRAFRMLQGDVARGRLHEAVGELASEVEGGVPLGEAYGRHRDAFPPLYRALIEVGMVSGDLPGVLDEIARHAARRADFLARLRGALAYPAVAAAFVLLLGGGLLVFVGPSLFRLPEGMELDPPFSLAAGALVGLGLLVAGYFFAGWLRAPLARAARRAFRPRLLGRIQLLADKAQLCATLALLLRRQVPLPQALALAGEACEDRALRRDVVAMAAKAGAGAPLHDLLRDASVLEPTLLWIVGAAEGTGETPRALEDVADVCAARLARAVDRLTTFATPAAELIVGLVVFLFAYSFLLPLFEYAERLFRL